jgi:hypothetical protein
MSQVLGFSLVLVEGEGGSAEAITANTGFLHEPQDRNRDAGNRIIGFPGVLLSQGTVKKMDKLLGCRFERSDLNRILSI